FGDALKTSEKARRNDRASAQRREALDDDRHRQHAARGERDHEEAAGAIEVPDALFGFDLGAGVGGRWRGGGLVSRKQRRRDQRDGDTAKERNCTFRTRSVLGGGSGYHMGGDLYIIPPLRPSAVKTNRGGG